MFKEQKFIEWARLQAEKAREAEGLLPKTKPPQPKLVSCQLNQLDQMLGIQKNPHVSVMKGRRTTQPEPLLRHGVSADGEGRAAYLLHQGRTDPKERYGR